MKQLTQMAYDYAQRFPNDQRLNKAFKAMRKVGLLARQNYLCCGNCGGTALANRAEVVLDKAVDGATDYDEKALRLFGSRYTSLIKGCVFFHEQDNEHRMRERKFMLRFGELNTSKYGTIGLPTKEVGELVCRILTECQIAYTWDGNPDRCIEVNELEVVAPAN